MPLLDEVRKFLKHQKITDCRIYAALSGGADSVCLLHTLHALREELSLDLRAIHIQHNLRGEESVRDEEFCRSFCKDLGVSLTVVSCDIRKTAQERHLSIETAARECRYDAFEALDGFVATAHTASDNLETILLRMTRGTGLKGLCGIPPIRGRFLRPLLQVTRSQVEEYARMHEISYVTDSTNGEDVYRRNFLRHHVVPKLRACNPSVEDICTDMTKILSVEEDFLAEQARSAFSACRQTDGSLKGLDAFHPALQRRCIGMLLEEWGLSGYRNILTVQELLTKGGSAELRRGDVCAHVSRGVLWLEMPMENVPRKKLNLGENCIFSGFIAEAEVISRADAEKFARIHTMFANSVLDYDIINRSAELHGRTSGLRLKTVDRAHRISIRKWLNAQVPPTQRSTVHFLSDDEGLLWVQGLGAAERAAVTERTQNMLFLRIRTKNPHYHEINTNGTQQ